MNRHQVLRAVHRRFQPRTYLEIGVSTGRSLALSRTRSIGVDPAFKITHEIDCDVALVRSTSDDFFARPEPLARLGGSADLVFIDGMHLFEFALRDFINAEAWSLPTTVVIFDDMLPRTVDEAARERHTVMWAGDVYKVTLALQRHRPDLVVVPIDSAPTGTVAVLGLDPSSSTLRDRYDDVVAELAADDPQPVPAEVLDRHGAAAPERFARAAFWGRLASLRDSGEDVGVGDVRALLGAAPVLADWVPASYPRRSSQPAS